MYALTSIASGSWLININFIMYTLDCYGIFYSVYEFENTITLQNALKIIRIKYYNKLLEIELM